MKLSITILGGIPVVMECDVYGAEPDVGIMLPYVDSWHIVEAFDKPYKGDWLYNRIDATKGEDERIIDALNEALSEKQYEYDNY